MKLIEALNWRYATKKFDSDKVVCEALIDSLLQMGNLSATSYGLQPFRFVVVHNRELQEQLVSATYGQRQVADASHVIVIAVRTDIDQPFVSDYFSSVEEIRELAEGQLDQFKTGVLNTIGKLPADEKLAWATKQAYIVLGTLLAGCAELELDSCPMEGFVPEQYNLLLDLKSHNLHASLVLPVGYRAADDLAAKETKIRKPMSEMVVRL